MMFASPDIRKIHGEESVCTSGAYHSPNVALTAQGMTSTNSFLLCAIAPFSASEDDIIFPDSSVTPRTTKVVTYATTLSPASIDPADPPTQIMVVFRAQQHGTEQVQYYIKRPADAEFTYYGIVAPDQDLSEDFKFIRPVAGGVELLSESITTTNSTLGGSVTAIRTRDPPEFMTVTTSSLPTFAENNRALQQKVRLSDGIVMLSGAPSSDQFVNPETNVLSTVPNSMYSERISYLWAPAKDETGAPVPIDHNSPGWLLDGTTYSIFDTARGVAIPPNMDGLTAFRSQLSLASSTMVTTNADFYPQIQCRVSYFDQGALMTKTFRYAVTANANLFGYPQTTLALLDTSYHFPSPIVRIEIIGYGSISPTVGDEARLVFPNQNGNTTSSASLIMTNVNVGSQANNSGVCIAIIEGIEPSTSINVTARMLYETVPNKDLARNMRVSNAGSRFLMSDLVDARVVLENPAHFGIYSIWNRSSYLEALSNGSLERVASRDMIFARTAGLKSFIAGAAKFWKRDGQRIWKAVKPLAFQTARSVAPGYLQGPLSLLQAATSDKAQIARCSGREEEVKTEVKSTTEQDIEEIEELPEGYVQVIRKRQVKARPFSDLGDISKPLYRKLAARVKTNVACTFDPRDGTVTLPNGTRAVTPTARYLSACLFIVNTNKSLACEEGSPSLLHHLFHADRRKYESLTVTTLCPSGKSLSCGFSDIRGFGVDGTAFDTYNTVRELNARTVGNPALRTTSKARKKMERKQSLHTAPVHQRTTAASPEPSLAEFINKNPEEEARAVKALQLVMQGQSLQDIADSAEVSLDTAVRMARQFEKLELYWDKEKKEPGVRPRESKPVVRPVALPPTPRAVTGVKSQPAVEVKTARTAGPAPMNSQSNPNPRTKLQVMLATAVHNGFLRDGKICQAPTKVSDTRPPWMDYPCQREPPNSPLVRKMLEEPDSAEAGAIALILCASGPITTRRMVVILNDIVPGRPFRRRHINRIMHRLYDQYVLVKADSSDGPVWATTARVQAMIERSEAESRRSQGDGPIGELENPRVARCSDKDGDMDLGDTKGGDGAGGIELPAAPAPEMKQPAPELDGYVEDHPEFSSMLNMRAYNAFVANYANMSEGPAKVTASQRLNFGMAACPGVLDGGEGVPIMITVSPLPFHRRYNYFPVPIMGDDERLTTPRSVTNEEVQYVSTAVNGIYFCTKFQENARTAIAMLINTIGVKNGTDVYVTAHTPYQLSETSCSMAVASAFLRLPVFGLVSGTYHPDQQVDGVIRFGQIGQVVEKVRARQTFNEVYGAKRAMPFIASFDPKGQFPEGVSVLPVRALIDRGVAAFFDPKFLLDAPTLDSLICVLHVMAMKVIASATVKPSAPLTAERLEALGSTHEQRMAWLASQQFPDSEGYQQLKRGLLAHVQKKGLRTDWPKILVQVEQAVGAKQKVKGAAPPEVQTFSKNKGYTMNDAQGNKMRVPSVVEVVQHAGANLAFVREKMAFDLYKKLKAAVESDRVTAKILKGNTQLYNLLKSMNRTKKKAVKKKAEDVKFDFDEEEDDEEGEEEDLPTLEDVPPSREVEEEEAPPREPKKTVKKKVKHKKGRGKGKGKDDAKSKVKGLKVW